MFSPINGQYSEKYCREAQIVSAITASLIAGVALAVILTHLQHPLGVVVPLGLLGTAELVSLALLAAATVAKRHLKKPAPLSTNERAPSPESTPVSTDTLPPALTISEIEPLPAPSLTDLEQHRDYWDTLLTPFFDGLINFFTALYRMHYASQNTPWMHQKDYKKWLEGWTKNDVTKIQQTLTTLKDVLLRNETFLTGTNLIDPERLPHFCQLIDPDLDLKGTDLLCAAFLKAHGYEFIPKTESSVYIEEICEEEDLEAQYIAFATMRLFECGYEVEQQVAPQTDDPTAFFRVIFPALLQDIDKNEHNLLPLLKNGQKLLCKERIPVVPANAEANKELLSLLFDNTQSHEEKMSALKEKLGEEGTPFLSLFAEQGGAKAGMIKATIWTAVNIGGISPILSCLGAAEPAIPGMTKQELNALITPIVVLFGMPLCHAILDQTNTFKDPIKQWIDRHYVDIVTNSYAPLTKQTSVIGIFKEATKLFNHAAEQFQGVTLERHGK